MRRRRPRRPCHSPRWQKSTLSATAATARGSSETRSLCRRRRPRRGARAPRPLSRQAVRRGKGEGPRRCVACPPSPSVEGGLPSTSTEAEPSAPPLERSASWGRVGIKRSNSIKRPTHADSAAGPSGARAHLPHLRARMGTSPAPAWLPSYKARDFLVRSETTRLPPRPRGPPARGWSVDHAVPRRTPTFLFSLFGLSESDSVSVTTLSCLSLSED